MKTLLIATMSIATVASFSCKKRSYNTVKGASDGASSAGSGDFTGASFPETRPSSFAVADTTVAAGIARFGFAPIT